MTYNIFSSKIKSDLLQIICVILMLHNNYVLNIKITLLLVRLCVLMTCHKLGFEKNEPYSNWELQRVGGEAIPTILDFIHPCPIVLKIRAFSLVIKFFYIFSLQFVLYFHMIMLRHFSLAMVCAQEGFLSGIGRLCTG